MDGLPVEWANWAITYVLVLARLSGLVMLMPGWGGQTVPLQVRALLAVCLSLLVWPLAVLDAVRLPTHLAALAELVAVELLTGLLLGLAVAALVAGVQLAGHLISQTAGLHIAEVVDPVFESSASVHAKVYEWTTLAVFFSLGGHRLLVAAVLDSLRLLPLGNVLSGDVSVRVLIEAVQISFALALRMAAPVALTLLVSAVILGLISRAVPQLNILVMGFNLNSLLLLAAMLLALGGGTVLFSRYAEHIVDTLQHRWAEAASGMPSVK